MNNRRRREDSTDRRIKFLGVLLLALFAVAIVRAVDLQVYRAPALKLRAEDQYSRKSLILPARGKILDRNNRELAASVPGSSAYVTGDKILENQDEFEKICATLKLDRYKTAEMIRKRGDACTTIKRRLIPAEEEAARKLSVGSKFFGVAPQPVRYYPNKSLAGQILGYVGQDGEGLGGLEAKYEEILRGNPIWLYAEKDARADQMLTEAPDPTKARGKSLLLTIDQSIQHIVEEELEKAVEEHGARGGFSMFVDPATGEILALAQVPRLNPNDFANVKAEDRKIKTISDVFEPGSTMKPVFISLLLESGAAKFTDQVFCENGKWNVFGKVIHDHSAHGVMGLGDIIKVSSNIGVAKLSQRIPNRTYREALLKYGFGRDSGIELKGESKGIVQPVSNWAKITPMTMAYGQGISVTAVQMVSAFSALANHGVMMKPHLVKAVLDENGKEIERIAPQEAGRPVSPVIADTVVRWMEAVVQDPGGTAKSADGSGYSVAGKTGTAWKASKGGYDNKKVVASFIGVAPSRAPRIVGLVALDEPTIGSLYGGIVAAPVYKSICGRVLNYLSVPPDKPVTVAEKDKKVGKKDKADAKGDRKGEIRDDPDNSDRPDDMAAVEDPALLRRQMPDLAGLTMREAVKRLEQTGVAIRLDLKGSGFVAGQDPAPGRVLDDGALCTIVFDSPFNIAQAK